MVINPLIIAITNTTAEGKPTWSNKAIGGVFNAHTDAIRIITRIKNIKDIKRTSVYCKIIETFTIIISYALENENEN